MGGGLFNSGTAAITNVTFLDNLALGGEGVSSFGQIHSGDAFGGGVYTEAGQIAFSFCTFASNKTAFGKYGLPGEAKGSDLYIKSGEASSGGSVFGSTTNGSVFGTVTDGGFNLIVDNSAAFSTATSLSFIDPKFGPAMETYIPLGPGSPALNSADPVNFPTTDQLGTTRPKGSGPDRGAIEFNGFWLEGLTVLSSDTVRVTVANQSGAAYIVQQSTDLNSWTEAARSNTTTTEPQQFTLPISPNGGTASFWRVISQP
jgi:hypothetical protein